jgi:hypothetical protein
MAKVTAKAQETEERVRASLANTKEELAHAVGQARARAAEHTEQWQQEKATEEEGAQQDWSQMKSTWHRHVVEMKEKKTARKAERDAKAAEKDAVQAERYAEDAVDFALSAIEEAEYAVLDAALARMDADQAQSGLA